MANDEHVALLKQGVDAWNAWRKDNPNIRPNLSEADLHRANLSGADLSGADLSRVYLREAKLDGANLSEETGLSGAHLGGADLGDANLSRANLNGAHLPGAYLGGANLNEAKPRGANLSGADLREADLRDADLSGADLQTATLVGIDLTGADLTGCRIYGVSAWDIEPPESDKQHNLIITPPEESAVTVDNIEVAQFIYLRLYNQKIRDVIDTLTSKTVLILGRFTEERKAVLDALRKKLRKRDYLPILFDFERPRSRDTDETITLLARMARFVIADVTDAKAVLQELRAIVPDLPSLPVQSTILATQEEPGMFDFYDPRKRPSFLTVHRYADQQQLLADLGDKVIRPAELKAQELRDYFEIKVDGVVRSYRGLRDTAIEAPRFLQRRQLGAVITITDLRDGSSVPFDRSS